MKKRMTKEEKEIEIFKNENGHEIDGVWFPRVTKILSVKAKPALYRYYAGHDTFENAEEMKERAAQEGTLIHETVERILKNESYSVPDEISASIEAFKAFMNESDLRSRFIELPIANTEHMYSGTADIVGELFKKSAVIDIKTGTSIYRDYRLQTSAYFDWVKRIYPITTRFIIRINQFFECKNCIARLRNKGGFYKVSIPYEDNITYAHAKRCSHEWKDFMIGEVEVEEFDSQEKDFTAFLACKKLWEWDNDAMLGKVGYYDLFTK